MKIVKILLGVLLGSACILCMGCGKEPVHKPTTGELIMPDYTDEIQGVIARFDKDLVMLLTETNGPIVLGGDMNFEGLETGNHLTIYCDGVMESYPCQAIVKEMMLNSKGSPEDLPEKMMEDLKEMGYVLDGYPYKAEEENAMLTYQSITMEEAKKLFETPGDYLILDVRRPDEFASGHIPGAINVANELILDTQPTELPDQNQLIYVYCRSGNRSKQAATKLCAMGYTKIIEFGGIMDWTGEIEK